MKNIGEKLKYDIDLIRGYNARDNVWVPNKEVAGKALHLNVKNNVDPAIALKVEAILWHDIAVIALVNVRETLKRHIHFEMPRP